MTCSLRQCSRSDPLVRFAKLVSFIPLSRVLDLICWLVVLRPCWVMIPRYCHHRRTLIPSSCPLLNGLMLLNKIRGCVGRRHGKRGLMTQWSVELERLIDGRRWIWHNTASKPVFVKGLRFPIPCTSSMTKWVFGVNCGSDMTRDLHLFLMAFYGTPLRLLFAMIFVRCCATSLSARRRVLLISRCEWCHVGLMAGTDTHDVKTHVA